MRKTLCVCLVLVLCLFATGYAEEAAVDADTLFGTIENGAYENKYVGLGFKIDDWQILTDEDYERMREATKALMPEEMQQFKENAGILTVLRAKDLLNNAINIKIKYIAGSSEYTETDTKTLIKSNIDDFQQWLRETGFANAEAEYVSTTIEGREYDGMLGSYDILTVNQHMYSRLIMFIRGEYMVIITASSVTEDRTEEICQRFYHLKDSEE